MRSRAPRPSVFLLGALLVLTGSESLWEEERGSREILSVPPYLETLVFDVAGAPRESGLRVVPPDRSGAEAWEELRPGGSLRTIVLHRPVPGRWDLRTDHPARVEMLSRSFSVHGALLAREEPIRPGDRIALIYQLLNTDGSPLRELPGYPLILEMDLVRPDGQRTRLDMKRRAGGASGGFQVRGEVACDLPGRYWTEAVVLTRDVDGRGVTVLRDRWSGFSVASPSVPRTPLDSAGVFADIEQRIPQTVAPGDRGGVNDR